MPTEWATETNSGSGSIFFLPMILLPCFRSSSSITSPNCSMALTAWEKTGEKEDIHRWKTIPASEEPFVFYMYPMGLWLKGSLSVKDKFIRTSYVLLKWWCVSQLCLTRAPLWASSGWTLPCSVRPVPMPAFLHDRRKWMITIVLILYHFKPPKATKQIVIPFGTFGDLPSQQTGIAEWTFQSLF